MADRTSGRNPKRKLTRAELKAYRSRREAERRRIAVEAAETVDTERPERRPASGSGTSYTMTRDDEFIVIRQDLMRLMVIVAVLLVLLVIATIVLR